MEIIKDLPDQAFQTFENVLTNALAPREASAVFSIGFLRLAVQ